MAAYRCVICQKPVRYDGGLPELYPFCSERCRMVDLGYWLHERYSIERELPPDEPEPPMSVPGPPADD